MTDIAWTSGTWTTAPAHVDVPADGMRVTAVEGSDAWRTTSYGFVHDTEHALLAPLDQGTAMEVSFHLDFSAQFDQAGVFVRVDDTTWAKAGVERSDGDDSLGAVVTRGVSDWSLGAVPGWHGRLVTIRASRSGDALTIRARVDDEPWRLVRVSPLDPDAAVTAGPMCCAPSRGDLTVHFTAWRTGPADASLHPDERPGCSGSRMVTNRTTATSHGAALGRAFSFDILCDRDHGRRRPGHDAHRLFGR